MEGIYNFPSRKFQEGKKLKRTECISRLNQRAHNPNLRERGINMSKNEADTISTSCESYSFDFVNEGSFNQKGNPSTALRKDMSKKSTKAMAPKLSLNFLNKELEELNMEFRKIQEEFENAEKELLNSKNEVSTKSLISEESDSDTLKEDWELQALKNDLSEKTTDVKNLTEELQKAKEAIHKLNLENQELKEAVRMLKCQNEIGNALLEEEMKFYCDVEMKKVRSELSAIKKELRVEKILRTRISRALQVLRKNVTSMVGSLSTSDHFSGELY